MKKCKMKIATKESSDGKMAPYSRDSAPSLARWRLIVETLCQAWQDGSLWSRLGAKLHNLSSIPESQMVEGSTNLNNCPLRSSHIATCTCMHAYIHIQCN